MDSSKRKALEAAGFRVGDAGDFLGLTDAERELVELRARLSAMVAKTRKDLGISQPDAASLIGTTQPRVSRIESGGAGVSLDQMFKAYFAIGGRLPELRTLFGGGEQKTPRRPKASAKKASIR